MGDICKVELRRRDTAVPWGFSLKGGQDHGLPLFIQKISPNSIADRCGLCPGDAILQIGRTNATVLTHGQAKGELLRAGNDVDFTVQRNVVDPSNPQVQLAAAPSVSQQRAQIVEEPVAKFGGPTYKPLEPKIKTYQVLKEELPATQQTGARPASIFDRKKELRSEYLQASGSSIQKAYGQS